MQTHVDLRPWTTEDAVSLAWFANDEEVSKFLKESFPFPYHYQNACDFIQMASAKIGTTQMAISVEGIAVGGIGLYLHTDIYKQNAEIAYWLGRPYWGKGIMPIAVERMVDWGFRNFPLTRIFARTFGENIASQRVLQKAGFVLEAELLGTFLKGNKIDNELIFGIRKIKESIV